MNVIEYYQCLDWVEPLDLSTEAQEAAQKRRDAILGLVSRFVERALTFSKYTDPICTVHFILLPLTSRSRALP